MIIYRAVSLLYGDKIWGGTKVGADDVVFVWVGHYEINVQHQGTPPWFGHMQPIDLNRADEPSDELPYTQLDSTQFKLSILRSIFFFPCLSASIHSSISTSSSFSDRSVHSPNLRFFTPHISQVSPAHFHWFNLGTFRDDRMPHARGGWATFAHMVASTMLMGVPCKYSRNG